MTFPATVLLITSKWGYANGLASSRWTHVLRPFLAAILLQGTFAAIALSQVTYQGSISNSYGSGTGNLI